MIPYFLSNISGKNHRNRMVYVKIIASQSWDVFLRHGVYSANKGDFCLVLNVVHTEALDILNYY